MRTVQEIFDLALETHYGKSEFADSLYMCVTLKRLVEENLITREEALLAGEEIYDLLATTLQSTLVNFVVDGITGMLATNFIPYGKRIYADWANKEEIIKAIREEIKQHLLYFI